MQFLLHTKDTAPEAAPLLNEVEKRFGLVPNLLAVMAEAPALLEGYLSLSRLLDGSSLDPVERQVVILSASFENGCTYCMAAHSAAATRQKVAQEIVQALRTGRPLADRKLEALRQLTAAIVASRGHPPDAELREFVAAGYGPRQVLEVVLGVGMKTLSNYANHLADTPLDRHLASAAWAKPA